MREYAKEVLGGAQILMHALQLDVCFVVVESDKPQALLQLGEQLSALDDDRIVLKQVPTIALQYTTRATAKIARLSTRKR